MSNDKERQEVYAIAHRIAKKVHIIADKTGMTVEDTTKMLIGLALDVEKREAAHA